MLPLLHLPVLGCKLPSGVTSSLKTSNYEEVAAQLHEQLSYDKPWYLLDPEVGMK